MLNSQWNLTNELEPTLVTGMYANLEIFSSRYKHALSSAHGCAFGSMSFENHAKLTSLIPAMDASVGASTEAEAIFIKCRALELSLREPLTKRAMLE